MSMCGMIVLLLKDVSKINTRCECRVSGNAFLRQ
jgi:hypothetical protein